MTDYQIRLTVAILPHPSSPSPFHPPLLLVAINTKHARNYNWIPAKRQEIPSYPDPSFCENVEKYKNGNERILKRRRLHLGASGPTFLPSLRRFHPRF